MWDYIIDLNWELTIALGALSLSIYTFYVQNVKEELAIYPSDEDNVFYVTIENTGKSPIKDYTLQVVNMENLRNTFEEELNKMDLVQRQAKFSLAPNRTTTFTIASKRPYPNSVPFPIITFDAYNAKGRKVDTFTCDFNMYRNKITVIKVPRKDRT
ncbi:hypothetical protein [Exiguobacterium sp. s146]|uniref:hypothetical protein n=1 Tax=Exiguobacterium sp. s146 TaxID=2751223 RepID=UPI001BEA8B03|nr:hypothetical protein [Exiguobacterium sp. s146]